MDVRESLLEAAVVVYAEAGARGATTRRIASAAGVNEVTLFRHFRTKDELLKTALERFARRATASIVLPADPVAPRTELLAWARAHHRQLYRVRALIRKLMAEREEHPAQCARGLQVSGDIARGLVRYLGELKRRGLAQGGWDEHAAAAMLMGALFTDAMGRDTMRERYPYSMRTAVENYVDLFVSAIGVAPDAAAAG